MMADDGEDGEYDADDADDAEGEDGVGGEEGEEGEEDEEGEEGEVGEVWDADLAEAAVVSCPYCGAEVDLLIDAGGGPIQEYVEDCEVCCRPWLVRVALRGDGRADVDVRTLDQ
jgi:hypothetical protein